MTMFAVIQPDSPRYGVVISRHRSREAAEVAIKRECEAYQRSPRWNTGSWLDREVAPCAPRAVRCRRESGYVGLVWRAP